MIALKNLLKTAKLFAGLGIVVLGLFFLEPLQQLEEAEELAEVVQKVVDPKQLACLAKNIYHEAGSESVQGQAAVARVVMNRISHGFGKNPCAVVYQVNHIPTETHNGKVIKVKQCQFSWVCEGKAEPNKNSIKYKQAEQIAYNVLAYDSYTDVVPKTALFFHNLSVDPLWPYKQVARIGNHIFYSKAKKSTQKTIATNENNI